MEKGIVDSYDKSCGMGVITRLGQADLKFYDESVNGGSRAGLKQGDSVCFDVSNVKNLNIAISIRKY